MPVLDLIENIMWLGLASQKLMNKDIEHIDLS